MPKEAKVAVIEDDKDYREFIKEFLDGTGHTIVAMAVDYPEALALAKKLIELKVDVVTLDQNLTEGEHDGWEGNKILEEIRKYAPNVKVIGLSSVKFPGVDLDLGKRDLAKIGETIDKL